MTIPIYITNYPESNQEYITIDMVDPEPNVFDRETKEPISNGCIVLITMGSTLLTFMLFCLAYFLTSD